MINSVFYAERNLTLDGNKFKRLCRRRNVTLKRVLERFALRLRNGVTLRLAAEHQL